MPSEQEPVVFHLVFQDSKVKSPPSTTTLEKSKIKSEIWITVFQALSIYWKLQKVWVQWWSASFMASCLVFLFWLCSVLFWWHSVTSTNAGTWCTSHVLFCFSWVFWDSWLQWFSPFWFQFCISCADGWMWLWQALDFQETLRSSSLMLKWEILLEPVWWEEQVIFSMQLVVLLSAPQLMVWKMPWKRQSNSTQAL